MVFTPEGEKELEADSGPEEFSLVASTSYTANNSLEENINTSLEIVNFSDIEWAQISWGSDRRKNCCWVQERPASFEMGRK